MRRFATFRTSSFGVHPLFRHSDFRHSLPMPYEYLEDFGTADIAFQATGRDLPELFMAAADATMNVLRQI